MFSFLAHSNLLMRSESRPAHVSVEATHRRRSGVENVKADTSGKYTMDQMVETKHKSYRTICKNDSYFAHFPIYQKNLPTLFYMSIIFTNILPYLSISTIKTFYYQQKQTLSFFAKRSKKCQKGMKIPFKHIFINGETLNL